MAKARCGWGWKKLARAATKPTVHAAIQVGGKRVLLPDEVPFGDKTKKPRTDDVCSLINSTAVANVQLRRSQ